MTGPGKFRFLGGVGILGFILVLLLAPLGPARSREKSTGPPPVPVVVAAVLDQPVATRIELVGTAKANRSSQVAAEVAGVVRSIHFQEGEKVGANEPLVKMDKTHEEFSLKGARAALEGIGIQLQEAHSDLNRSKKLIKSKSISTKSLERDLFKVRNLEKTVNVSRAEAARIADKISRMTVKAPFSGYVVAQHTEVGQWLTPGSPVATVVDLSTIKVRGALPERYLTKIKKGDPAEVVFDALGDKVFKGEVTTIVPEADVKSRNFPVEISLANQDGLIKSGLLARVRITGRKQKLLLVPKDALVLDRGKAVVFVVKGDTVFSVPVGMGEAYGQRIEVIGEIAPGQMVVVQGNERLRPGQKVMVVSPKADNTSGTK